MPRSYDQSARSASWNIALVGKCLMALGIEFQITAPKNLIHLSVVTNLRFGMTSRFSASVLVVLSLTVFRCVFMVMVLIHGP